MAHRLASRLLERALDAGISSAAARLSCLACPTVSCPAAVACPACPHCPLSSFACPDCRPSCECHPAAVNCDSGVGLFVLVAISFFVLGVTLGTPLVQACKCLVRRVVTPARRARSEEDLQVTTSPDLRLEARAQVALARASRSQ